jgi:hypothetical protein
VPLVGVPCFIIPSVKRSVGVAMLTLVAAGGCGGGSSGTPDGGDLVLINDTAQAVTAIECSARQPAICEVVKRAVIPVGGSAVFSRTPRGLQQPATLGIHGLGRLRCFLVPPVDQPPGPTYVDISRVRGDRGACATQYRSAP